MATFSDMAIDPTTGMAKPKQQKNLPYLNENGTGILPVVQPNESSIAKGNTAVMAGAQNMALGQTQSPIQSQTQSMVQKMQADPSFGYKAPQYKANALSNFDLNQANAVKAFKEQNADMGGSGQVNANLLKTMMAQNVDRSNLENQIDMQDIDRAKKDWVDAINAGNTQLQSDSAINAQSIQNLLNVRGAYEGERAQNTAFNQDMVKLEKTFGQDMAKMVASQNWQGAQNELDRRAAIAKQTGDINAQKEIAALQHSFDMEKLNKTQDWQSAQNKIENDLKLAMQSNDINATASNIQKQLDLDKWKHDNGQKFTAEQNALSRALESSLAQMKISADSTNSALDRELNREIESGRLTMQEKQLALSAAQFADEASFKREALKSGVDQATADRIWKSSEAALDRTGAKELKTMELESAQSLMNLKAQIDKGMLVQQQDFEAVQRGLDRALETAKQKNDIQAQKDILTQKAEIDKIAQDKQNEFNNAQRVATQSWQTGENVRAEDAQKAAMYFDAEQKRLLQSNDIEGQKTLATIKAGFDLNMQTLSMAHDEKMAYLENQYAEAKANNDVNRQKDILSFTYNQDISKMVQQYGIDTAKMQVQGQIEAALNQGDYEHAEAMQKALFVQQSAENAKDRVIQNAQVALQQKGIDLQALEQQYSQLEKLVQAGTLDKSVLNDFVANNLKGTGVTMKAPDPLEAQKEADREFAALQVEYARTHPGAIDPATGKMTADAVKDFNNFVNKTMYGEVTTGAEAASQKAEAALSDPAEYKNLWNDPSVKVWEPELRYSTGGVFGADKRYIQNAPDKGSIIRYGSNFYEVASDKKMDPKGQDSDYFTVRDLKDGTIKKISVFGKDNNLHIVGF